MEESVPLRNKPFPYSATENLTVMYVPAVQGHGTRCSIGQAGTFLAGTSAADVNRSQPEGKAPGGESTEVSGLSPADARERIKAWKRHNNEVRPHTTLGGLMPRTFVNQVITALEFAQVANRKPDQL